MKNSISFYVRIAKRWIWLVVLGVAICSGATYIISKMITPVYQASAIIVINLGSSTSAYDNLNASLQAVPTYAQLLTSPEVLGPVIAEHPGLTLKQLNAMITVKPQPNTQLIELDVQSNDPRLAAQLANQVSQSFALFVNTKLPASLELLSAQTPTDPVRPRPLENAVIGAFVGLGLALALIIVFEWMDDRLAGPEEVQELIGVEILTAIPYLSRRRRAQSDREIALLGEENRMLFAKLQAAHAIRPFKLIMITSALPGEGKTTVAVHLAREMAEAGKRVLLVDASLRRPGLDEHFPLDFQLNGYSSVASAFVQMSAQTQVQLSGQDTDIPNLYILHAGKLPSGLTYSLYLQWAQQLLEYFKKAPFDYVVLDSPPLLPVPDAQLLASLVETIVLVINASKLPRKMLARAKQALSNTRTSVMGAVINKNPWPSYDVVLQYLHYIQETGTPISAITPPETPRPDDVADASGDTVILPSAGRHSENRGEQVDKGAPSHQQRSNP